ncbi:DUF2399 domain-containing protein [Saccharopolyspora sp. CA-218241]|uniref:DUF2399 domain-containing protein n=1 Tax=Saccharopolyspora sp. CA-218241 TaxID=3240027 RepID=UPI003D95A5A8
MADPADIRRAWDVEALRGLWTRARAAVEAEETTFRLELPDDAARQAVGDLYGRPMWGEGTRISVPKLDAALRASPFGVGLREALELLHGRPLGGARPTAAPARSADPLAEQLAAHGLDGADWAGPWIDWVHRYGRISRSELPALARDATAVLAELTSDRVVSRAELAALTGDPHALDTGTALSRVVFKAASLALGDQRPRRDLWASWGVVRNAASAGAVCWALPLVGADPWSRGVRERAELGLPAHLSLLDLRAAPDRLVEPGTAIAVCEHPRLVEAVLGERIGHPVVRATGPLASALLSRLAADGAELRVHGDFDWPGVAAVARLVERTGARPWRMAAADYREALDRAAARRTDLGTLVGDPVRTPWDPDLAGLMADTGRAIDEEMVLPSLLADLRS